MWSIEEDYHLAVIMRKMNHPFTPAIVGGRYELVRTIGAGAYGKVFEAKDLELGRRVAVKVLDLGDSDLALREGQLLAELNHPNVVAIHYHGEGPDYRYFVLHYLPGPTLREWCRGKSPRKIIAMFIQAAQGLAAAHAKGLVHRDFKPSNVRISEEGQAVVVDFGLARRIDTLDGGPKVCLEFEGTLRYAAPERLIGEPGHEWSDQFSFCVALWEVLTGASPFGPCTRDTTTGERLRAVLRGPVGTPPKGRRVARVLRKGLSIETADRFPSMEALIDALAPKRRGWTTKALLLAVVAGVGLAQCVPSPRGIEFEFIANARARAWGAVAVVAARKGTTGKDAVDSLNSAMSGELSKNTSLELAIISQVVAIELEKRVADSATITDLDLLDAWNLAVLFAGDAGDAKLQRTSWDQLSALNTRLKAARVAPR